MVYHPSGDPAPRPPTLDGAKAAIAYHDKILQEIKEDLHEIRATLTALTVKLAEDYVTTDKLTVLQTRVETLSEWRQRTSGGVVYLLLAVNLVVALLAVVKGKLW